MIALGVSEMASSWGRLLRNRARVPLFHPENAFRLPGVLVAVAAAAVRDERFHRWLPVAGSVLFAGFVAFAYRNAG